jgi:hypothetical protein
VRLSDEQLLGSGSEFGRGRKGEEERVGRGFYSCGWSSIKAGSDEGLREGGGYCLRRGNGHQRGHRTEVEEDWQLGPTCQREGEGSGRTGSGEGSGPWASFLIWAEGFPRGPFRVFFSFLLFPFLFSYFFSRFCIKASNQLKPLSGIF